MLSSFSIISRNLELEVWFLFDAVGRNVANTGGFHFVFVCEMGYAANKIIRAGASVPVVGWVVVNPFRGIGGEWRVT